MLWGVICGIIKEEEGLKVLRKTNECSLICEECGNEVHYTVEGGGKCTNTKCGREIVLERGIEKLVVVLNNIGIRTHMSGDGHDGDFEWGIRHYPWITLMDESAKNTGYVESLIDEYNKVIGKEMEEEWKLGIECVTDGPKFFITPKNKNRRADKLQVEAKALAFFLYWKFMKS